MAIDFDILTWLVGLIILAGLLAILWRQKRTLSYLICFSVFWIYILLALKETIFPIPLDIGEIMKETGIPFISRVNLIPFYFGPFSNAQGIVITSVQNIFLTVPFGFGINFIASLRARNFLWLAIIVGLGIETIQLVISLGVGFPYRVIDINDMLMNAIGVLIGYGFFRAFAWLYLTFTQRLGIEHRGLPAYVYEVVSQVQTSTPPKTLNHMSNIS